MRIDGVAPHAASSSPSARSKPHTTHVRACPCSIDLDAHDGVNYVRTACIVAVSKAQQLLEPFIHKVRGSLLLRTRPALALPAAHPPPPPHTHTSAHCLHAAPRPLCARCRASFATIVRPPDAVRS